MVQQKRNRLTGKNNKLTRESKNINRPIKKNNRSIGENIDTNRPIGKEYSSLEDKTLLRRYANPKYYHQHLEILSTYYELEYPQKCSQQVL